jgi:hypothetical protein
MNEQLPQPNDEDLQHNIEDASLVEIAKGFQELSQIAHPLQNTFGESNHLYADLEQAPLGDNVGTQKKTETGFNFTEGSLNGMPFTVASSRSNTPKDTNKETGAGDLADIFKNLNVPEAGKPNTKVDVDAKTTDPETPKTEEELLDEIKKLHEHNEEQKAEELANKQTTYDELRDKEPLSDSVGENNILDAYADKINFSLDYSLGSKSNEAMRALIKLGYGPKAAAVLRELISGEGDFKLDSAAKVRKYSQLERERGARLNKHLDEIYGDKPKVVKKPSLGKRLTKAFSKESKKASSEMTTQEMPVVNINHRREHNRKLRQEEAKFRRERQRRVSNQRVIDSRNRRLSEQDTRIYTGNDEEIRRNLEDKDAA